MLPSFSSFQSMLNKKSSVAQAVTSLTSFSSSNGGTSNLNYSNYFVTGYSVYTLMNGNAQPTTSTNGTNSTGSFTLTVTGASAQVYILIVGAGGSGGSGNQGGGGGGSGQVRVQSITLPVGSYSCSFQVGAGNGGSDFVASAATYVDGGNGYGRVGSDSWVTINGSTYTAIGGSPGGPSYNSNNCTVGAYGGGAGNSIVQGTCTGSTGVVAFKGGNSPANSNIAGSGSGGSPMGNGVDGSTTPANASYNAIYGAAPSPPIASNNTLFLGTAFYSFNPVQYWAESGAGACCYRTPSGTGGFSLNGVTSSYGLSGRSSGAYKDVTVVSTNYASQPVNHTGSGGGGGFQNLGLSATGIAPAGSNGLILIAF